MKCILSIDNSIVLRRELFVLFFNNIHPILFFELKFQILSFLCFLNFSLAFYNPKHISYIPHYTFLTIFPIEFNL